MDKRIVFCFALSLFLFSCGTSKNVEPSSSAPAQENSSANEFSRNSVIVYLKNGTSVKKINELAEKYNLSVLYVYQNFSACALSSGTSLSDSALDSLISDLEKEDCVISVQKDYIMRLD